MASSIVPTIDLEPFLREGDEEAKKKAIEGQACSEYGFFQVVNHGVPLDLMTRAIDLFMEFFINPIEEKIKSIPKPGLNVYPENPSEFRRDSIIPIVRKVLEEIFPKLAKLALLIEGIVSLSLGLAPNFLKQYNNDRSCDFLMGLRYFPAEENENNGKSAHEDGNCIAFVFQDEVGGLEVLKKWTVDSNHTCARHFGGQYR